MVHPVGEGRPLARNLFQLALHEVAERTAGDIDVAAVALDEVHRHAKGVVGVALEAESVIEHEIQKTGAIGVGVRVHTWARADR